MLAPRCDGVGRREILWRRVFACALARRQDRSMYRPSSSRSGWRYRTPSGGYVPPIWRRLVWRQDRPDFSRSSISRMPFCVRTGPNMDGNVGPTASFRARQSPECRPPSACKPMSDRRSQRKDDARLPIAYSPLPCPKMVPADVAERVAAWRNRRAEPIVAGPNATPLERGLIENMLSPDSHRYPNQRGRTGPNMEGNVDLRSFRLRSHDPGALRSVERLVQQIDVIHVHHRHRDVHDCGSATLRARRKII
jgi:hypothetical protein